MNYSFPFCCGWVLPWSDFVMKCYLVFICSFIYPSFNQYWFWSKYSHVLSKHVLTFLWVDTKVHGWLLLAVNFRLKVAGVGRRLPSKRSAEWRAVAPDGTLQLTPSGESHIWSDEHFCSVGEPVRLTWKHFFGKYVEKNADSQNSISEQNFHFLLQFRVFLGFVSSVMDQRFSWFSFKKKKRKQKQNQKVMLLDENLRNGRSVKTGIKQQQKQENS